ncbi:hypothetical protein B0J12DRAFT_539447, partial [Macrophomina phaseolina]
LVAHVDTCTGPDLELPLGRHDFGVRAGDVEASVQASFIVRLDDIAAEGLAGAGAAVVGTLRAGKTTLRPATRPAIEIEQSILLLETKPELVPLIRLRHEKNVVAKIINAWLAISTPSLAHNKGISAQAEGVEV